MYLLSEVNKQRLNEWRFVAEDNSLTTVLFTPFWNWVAALVPDNVAPNVISLVGLLCLAKAFYLTGLYADSHPTLVCIAVVALIFAHQTLDAIDGKHARRIRNASPLGELFESICDNCGSVFLSLAFCRIVGWWTPLLAWSAMQIMFLFILNTHMFALRRGVVQFGPLTGPGEALVLIMAALALVGRYGLATVETELRALIDKHLVPVLAQVTPWDRTQAYAPIFLLALHIALLLWTLFVAVWVLRKDSASRNGVLLVLGYVSVLPLASHWFAIPNLGIRTDTFMTVAVGGMLLALLATDLIMCKMASRPLHPWVVVVALLSSFDNFVALALISGYLAWLLHETADALALPIMTVCCNVYCDGIYDLCHTGHKAIFKAAVGFGTRLYAGVVNDADATPYKRKPIMTAAEREREVAGCKYVYKVIPNAPCSGITEAFLRQHNIHLVVHGQEYDRDDDHYYRVPRQLGITRVLPRTDGISTTDLIKRIRGREQSEL